MKVSTLIKNAQDYMEMYGDQDIILCSEDLGEEFEINKFDAYKDKFCIEISEIEEVGEVEDDEEETE